MTTHISMKRKVSTPSFFSSHPVFSLDQAARASVWTEGGRVCCTASSTT